MMVLIRNILLGTHLLREAAILFWIPLSAIIFGYPSCVQRSPDGAVWVEVQGLYTVPIASCIYSSLLLICSVNTIITERIYWHLQHFPPFLSLRALSTLHTAVEFTGAWDSIVISCSLTATRWSSPWTLMPACLVGWISLFSVPCCCGLVGCLTRIAQVVPHSALLIFLSSNYSYSFSSCRLTCPLQCWLWPKSCFLLSWGVAQS